MNIAFSATFETLCPLCCGPIKPGHMLVRMRIKFLSVTSLRYVHASCYNSMLALESMDDITLPEPEG